MFPPQEAGAKRACLFWAKCTHNGGPTLKSLDRQPDDIPYTLEQLQLASSRAGHALLGRPADAWFRASDLAEELSLDRSTIRKHYADPMTDQGLLERRAAVGRGRPSNEYRVSEAGRQLRDEIERIIGLPAPAKSAATPVVVVTAGDADVAEALAAELERSLAPRRRLQAIAVEFERQ